MKIRRWIKRELRWCLYRPEQVVKLVLLVLVFFILLLQMNTLKSLHTYKDGSEQEDALFFLKHHQADLNYIVDDGGDVMSLDSFVVLPNIEAKLQLRDVKQKNFSHVTVRSPGRLGNDMFAYASLLGIAENNSMKAVLRRDSELRKYFEIQAPFCDEETVEKEWPKFHDMQIAGFDNRTFLLNSTMNIQLLGHFQSWKYFYGSQSQVKKEFTFKYEIESAAETWLQNAMHQYLTADMLSQELVYVGVHIRRGDFVYPNNIEKGYTVASREYIINAVKYFEKRFDPERLVFIVCSDDMVWVRTNIRQQTSLMVFSLFQQPAVDLAILSKCHHMITTVGTFSWWAGFLSKGITVYYKHYPRSGSEIDDHFSESDYFPPDWIAME